MASTSVSKVRNPSRRSRMPVISLVQTLEKAQGKNTSATALRPANDDSVTSCPNWSRSVKSGAAAPTAGPVPGPGPGRSDPFSELTLENLASRVARELIEEHDLAWNLVAGEVLLHPGLEVVLARTRRARAPADHDERLEALAELVVVDADRGDLDDRLVAGQAALDLLGGDGLTARPDHLVVAALDGAGGLGARPPHVTRRHQAVDDLLGLHIGAGAAGVPLEEQTVADEDPTGLAGRHLAAPVVEDLHLRGPGGSAGRRGSLSEV